MLVKAFLEARDETCEGQDENDHELSGCDWEVSLNVFVVNSTSFEVVFVFELIVPGVKSLNWTFTGPVAERNVSDLAIVPDLESVVGWVVLPNFKDEIGSVLGVLSDASLSVGVVFAEEALIDALRIGEIQGSKHVSDGGIVGAVNVPSDFVFVEDFFLDVMNGLIEEASGSGPDLFLVRVQTDINLEGVHVIYNYWKNYREIGRMSHSWKCLKCICLPFPCKWRIHNCRSRLGLTRKWHFCQGQLTDFGWPWWNFGYLWCNRILSLPHWIQSISFGLDSSLVNSFSKSLLRSMDWFRPFPHESPLGGTLWLQGKHNLLLKLEIPGVTGIRSWL